MILIVLRIRHPIENCVNLSLCFKLKYNRRFLCFLRIVPNVMKV